MTEPLGKIFSSDKDQAEYDNDSIFVKVGAFFVLGAILLIVIIIVALLYRYLPREGWVYKQVIAAKQKLMWNTVIRYSL